MNRMVALAIFSLIFLTACVERYHPDDLYLRDGILVINAHITDEPGVQTVEITRSSHIEDPGLDPELGSYVILLREDGESREFGTSSRPGFYTADLDADFLRTGMQFQLQVVTQDGKEYHSDYDRIRPVPAIDSLYYKVENVNYTGEDGPVPGIRFYADFTYDDDAFEYIRWELVETYEFHNPDMEAFYYPNRWTVYPLPEEDNPKVCYITHQLPAAHTLSTKQLNFGTFSRAFDFVPNDKLDQKLMYKYSLQVRQYSLSEAGFRYWNELAKNHQELGTMFDRQPALLTSNISNVNDENDKVLGFFTMSAVQEARAFAEDIPGLDNRPYIYYCMPVDSGPGSSRPTSFPAYFARATYDGATVYAQVNKHCVDCREYDGSTNIKPEFW